MNKNRDEVEVFIHQYSSIEPEVNNCFSIITKLLISLNGHVMSLIMVSVREAETSDNNIKLIDNLEEHSYIKKLLI